MNNLVYINGDGATLDDEMPFINYLSDHGFNVKFIPLLEATNDNITYQELEASNYCKYIDENIPKEFNKFIMLGISKGSHWVRVYSAKNPSRVIKLILIEPTTMIPNLLKQYELNRDNDFITEYYENPAKITREDSTHTAMDVVVSDNAKYIPKCKTTIIWTSRSNKNEPYTSDVIKLKKQFELYLRNNGCNLKVINIDAEHYITVNPRYFSKIITIIKG